MNAFDILYINYLDAVDEIDEGIFQRDYNHVARWSIIADTFAEML